MKDHHQPIVEIDGGVPSRPWTNLSSQLLFSTQGLSVSVTGVTGET
jgi:hypothetical protein